MGKYKLLELSTKPPDAARLDPKTTTTTYADDDDDDDERPVTKRDFKDSMATGIYTQSRPATSRGDGTKTR